MSKQRIHMQDHAADPLWFDVDANCITAAARPEHAWLIGRTVCPARLTDATLDPSGEPFETGDILYFPAINDTLAYPVLRIEPRED